MPDTTNALIDGQGRHVTYLRLSVTDRCDLRCTYCLPEHPQFLAARQRLGLDELDRLASAFIELGVRKLRLTGGEPLVRKDISMLVSRLARHLVSGQLDELTLSTNGTRLEANAAHLADAGVRRVNVSLDTLDADRYRTLTRGGDLSIVLRGIDAACRAGLQVRLNTVAIRGAIETEVDGLIAFAHERGMRLALIETMPLGDTGSSRLDQYLSLTALREYLSSRWTLTPVSAASGGPARFVRVEETGGLLGFITPISCDFCASCNRVRVSSAGRLYTCLGSDRSTDLVPALRGQPGAATLGDTIGAALAGKPRSHRFELGPSGVIGIDRTMATLGG